MPYPCAGVRWSGMTRLDSGSYPRQPNNKPLQRVSLEKTSGPAQRPMPYIAAAKSSFVMDLADRGVGMLAGGSKVAA
jgi:hypothetical protein